MCCGLPCHITTHWGSSSEMIDQRTSIAYLNKFGPFCLIMQIGNIDPCKRKLELDN